MKKKITKQIKIALKQLNIEGDDFVVDYSTESRYGDYSTNIALTSAKYADKNPQEIANQLVSILDEQIPEIDEIEVAGPGFINFFLSRSFIIDQINSALTHPDTWVANTEKEQEVILFEYTSPNLFKPLHIGNLVGNIIGESVSRLLENSGAVVYRINYPSDIGLTVAKGVWGLRETKGDPGNIKDLGDAYSYGNEKYENDLTAKSSIEAVNRALYAGTDSLLADLREQGIKTSRHRLDEICSILGTKFDKEIYESEASDVGRKIVEDNIGKVFNESEGAVIFDGERHGLHTRVFLNSQGLPTYEAKDLGNFVLKQESYPDWTASVIVTGNEQTEYFKVLHTAINCLFPETKNKLLKHIPTGFLTLTTGKMSSRKGNALSGESLIEEVRLAAMRKLEETRAEDPKRLSSDIAVAALKYQILRQKVGSNIVFDKQKALSFEGDSGPYLQYTYVRILSVLKRAEEANVTLSTKHVPANRYDIENIIYRFPDIALSATNDYAPHKMIIYLTELASEFNTFYAKEKIADPTDEFSGYKMALTKVVGIVIEKGLYMLGMTAPEKM